jgi:hypothetical protein
VPVNVRTGGGGAASNITGTDLFYAWGGNGGAANSNFGEAVRSPTEYGSGGRGGGVNTPVDFLNATPGIPGTVIVSFPTSDYPTSKLTVSGTVTTITSNPGKRVYQWTGPGSFTVN